ncbi:MAG: hypothetical protein M3P44_14200 [Actinomycetota bacterium]|nr:hypothetical protein [Actinomycetota bacterium]
MAEPAILRLIDRLERDALIEARVIARARLLLVDPGSLVYSCQRPGELRDAVQQIAGAREPQPGMPHRGHGRPRRRLSPTFTKSLYRS